MPLDIADNRHISSTLIMGHAEVPAHELFLKLAKPDQNIFLGPNKETREKNKIKRELA